MSVCSSGVAVFSVSSETDGSVAGGSGVEESTEGDTEAEADDVGAGAGSARAGAIDVELVTDAVGDGLVAAAGGGLVLVAGVGLAVAAGLGLVVETEGVALATGADDGWLVAVVA